MKNKLSVAIATFNEEKNIRDCLESVKDIADEIIIVDGTSSDNTVEVAKGFGAKVFIVPNNPMFHINKQISFDKSSGEWILYLDADERITSKLAGEIAKIIDMNNPETEEYQQKIRNRNLFLRHQQLLEKRDGKIGTEDGDYVAFFFPRLNFFLGKYLKYGGVYPDGVIRLFKRGKAYLPCKDVHEQMVVLGKVGWLQNDLLHIDSPTFSRYLERNSRYIDLISNDLVKNSVGKTPTNFIKYFLWLPSYWFLLTLIRHKGILDGFRGIIFSLFSSLRFPRAYYRYIFKKT